MDKFRQRYKKDSPTKYVEKEKTQSFVTDVKTLKENLKIREILRTVKMNSSMRIKAPRGSKVMQNKDFNDNENEDYFEDESNKEVQDDTIPAMAMNPDVVVNNASMVNEELVVEKEEILTDENTTNFATRESNSISYNNNEISHRDDDIINKSLLYKSNSVSEGLDFIEISSDAEKSLQTVQEKKVPPSPCDIKTRDRKLSLDHTMLSRREGLSQSEFDLHSIGKSPLERKSSFFRKKMDSFLKNTTEIFKRQSLGSKSPNVTRKGSISVSLQSLNENTTYNGDLGTVQLQKLQPDLHCSTTSLQSSLTGRSNSSLSVGQSELLAPDQYSENSSYAGSQPGLVSSQPFVDRASSSIYSLNEAYLQETLLNRAISMSSGLDSAHSGGRRKANRSNRVTWVASEGLTNYFRRVIQDEKSREIVGCHSYQDFSTIPENNSCNSKTDSKGRRLSYQRAVSGEDPVPSLRYQDSTLRRKHLIPENSETAITAMSGLHSPSKGNNVANYELANQLADFSVSGVPSLTGYCVVPIPDESFAYLLWAEKSENLEDFYNWKQLSPNEEARQAVIRELVCTEADYLRHLIAIVEVFIAAAHALQDSGKLLELETERLFTNIPDVLNASLIFWNDTFFPMVIDAVEKQKPFDTELMVPGFSRFRDLFQPYEKYVCEQTKALDYLRSLSNNSDFMTYLSWCHSQKSCNRLQLSDIMVKPMQRLTKYSLIVRRIITHTETDRERNSLLAMETLAKNCVLELNRSIRQKEELQKLDWLSNSIESFEIDFKDEDMERCFRLFSQTNLKTPMPNCRPNHCRSLIYEGDLRYKDNTKEIDVRVFLLTDMMLICKKLSKGGLYPYKLFRPKYMINNLITFHKYNSKNNKELIGLICVIVDDTTSSYHCFGLYDTSKENPAVTIKMWELKIKEAKLTYEIGMWFARNPTRDISEMDMDTTDQALATSAAKAISRANLEELTIEREARERVAVMLYRSPNVVAQASVESLEGAAANRDRPPGLQDIRHPLVRDSFNSSRDSRLSSFHQSTSAASYDEVQAGSSTDMYRAGSSVEHLIPPLNPEDGVTSITVNVVSESETETVVPQQAPLPPPVVMLQQASPVKTAPRNAQSQNTLRVQPQNVVVKLVHSLPDLTIDPSPPSPRPPKSITQPTASEKLYQSHQELLQRNRLQAQQQHQLLSPDQRGTSYPPPSPTRSLRASLKRGLAFSYSFKYPPLSKMGHVNSQSQQQAEAGPSTSHGTKNDKDDDNAAGGEAGTSTDKGDKKSKTVSGRAKSGDSSPSRKDDKEDKAEKGE